MKKAKLRMIAAVAAGLAALACAVAFDLAWPTAVFNLAGSADRLIPELAFELGMAFVTGLALLCGILARAAFMLKGWSGRRSNFGALTVILLLLLPRAATLLISPDAIHGVPATCRLSISRPLFIGSYSGVEEVLEQTCRVTVLKRQWQAGRWHSCSGEKFSGVLSPHLCRKLDLHAMREYEPETSGLHHILLSAVVVMNEMRDKEIKLSSTTMLDFVDAEVDLAEWPVRPEPGGPMGSYRGHLFKTVNRSVAGLEQPGFTPYEKQRARELRERFKRASAK